MTRIPYRDTWSTPSEREYVLLDPDPLTIEEPEPTPRSGCWIFPFLAITLVVLLASWTGPAASSKDIQVAAKLALITAPSRDAYPTPVPLAAVTRQGVWAFADPSYGPRYLAIPEGPGWKIRVCGPAACFDRVSTDAGPELFLQREGRLGDVSAADFPRICGVPISYGLCPGTLTIEGRAQRIKLPETATVGAG